MAARKNRLKIDDNWRDKIKAGVIMDRLAKHHLGQLEKPLDPTQIKAAEVILSRLVPSLSAVEQTTHQTGRSKEEILRDIKDLITAKPDLLSTLFPGYALVPVNVAPHQDDVSAHSAASSGENTTH